MRFGSRDSSEFWRPSVSTSFPGNEVAVASRTSPTQKSQWWIQGRGPVPPLICGPNWSPKSRKNFETGPPYLRVWLTAPPPAPPSWRFRSATDKHTGSLTKQWFWDGETVFRPYPRRLESLNVCRCLHKGSTFSLSYGKTGNKRRASCFATLLQNELNSHVARFTTQVNKTLKPHLLQDTSKRRR